MAADPTDASGGAKGVRHLSPRREGPGVAGPGAGGEVRDHSGRRAAIAVDEPVGHARPVAAGAEVVEDLVVDARRHAGDVARLLLLPDGLGGAGAAELLEDEPVVRRGAVE